MGMSEGVDKGWDREGELEGGGGVVACILVIYYDLLNLFRMAVIKPLTSVVMRLVFVSLNYVELQNVYVRLVVTVIGIIFKLKIYGKWCSLPYIKNTFKSRYILSKVIELYKILTPIV